MKMFLSILFLSPLFISCLTQTISNCDDLSSESNQCSTNKQCGCLYRSDTTDRSGICGLIPFDCSTMVPCSSKGNTCQDKNHVCIQHSHCNLRPLCYPLNNATEQTCPSITEVDYPQCDWTRDGVILLNQLNHPTGLYFDKNTDDISVYVTDSGNNRIVRWTPEQLVDNPVIVSINGNGQLLNPRDIVINKNNGNMFICDKNNNRIVQWRNNSKIGETFLENIQCESLVIDNQGSLIVPDLNKNRIIKWNSIKQKIIADHLNQPRDILIDEQDQSIYICDTFNHRILKFINGSRKSIIVAGGNGRGNRTDQLSFPSGIALHQNGDIYIADTNNNRIVRWTQQNQSGIVIVNGIFNNGFSQPQPFGLTFDKHYHNLYVTDSANSLFFRFYIDGTGNCATIT